MVARFFWTVLAKATLLALALSSKLSITAALPLASGSTSAKILKQLNFSNYGARLLRYGDLDGDQLADILLVQSKNQNITCLTALNFDGKLLWQVGKPRAKNFDVSSDLAVQIFDWDRDGLNEVIVVRSKQLQILAGKSGALIKSVPAPANDSIYLAKLIEPNSYALLLKDRYKNYYVYDSKLKLVRSGRARTGHYPFAYDLTADGVDELLIGYRLVGKSGEMIWDLSEKLPHHNDAADLGDLDGDGKLELAIATSKLGALVSASGKVLWTKPHKHSQHAVIGTFIWSEPSKQQAVFLDRGAGGIIYAYDREGKQLWATEKQGRKTILSTISGWSGKKGEDFLIAFRRDAGNPVLMDGQGKQVLEFPFSPALLENGAMSEHFLQHFDLSGDGREEILINNEKALWVYENDQHLQAPITIDEKLPNQRVFNASFYSGPQ